MPEWMSQLIELLFGKLGALGTVCLAAAGWTGYLLRLEQDAHERTRQQFQLYLESQSIFREKYLELLTELRTFLELLTRK